MSDSYTYAGAGVDIQAGNALVKAIAPLARATARPGADATLGGFGGFFDLKAAGYRDPLLVAANDGVGTKLKLAIESNRHDGVGIDPASGFGREFPLPHDHVTGRSAQPRLQRESTLLSSWSPTFCRSAASR